MLDAATSMPVPRDRNAWEFEAVKLRAALWSLLGDLPDLFTPKVRIVERASRDGFAVETIEYANGLGDTVYGYVLVPDHPTGAAVLYCHYHGGRYELGTDELFGEPHKPARSEQIPRGIALARMGYLVLGVDAYAFRERQHQGPAGVTESGRETEHALFKRFLWEGRTLWGMIIHDDLLALNYLLSRPEVDPERVAVTGASLGGSRATWIGALDTRVKLVAPVIQLTRYRNLLVSGGLNGHSVYYYVPGALRTDFDMEALVALAAPRPQIALVGDADPLSPADGVAIINDYARSVYDLYDAGESFRPVVYSGLGHEYTPAMFGELTAFMSKWL